MTTSVRGQRPSPAEVAALVDEAVLANARGRPALAGRLLDRALRALGPDEGDVAALETRCRVLITSALTRFETGRRAEAFALLTRAEELADAAGLGAVRALAAIQRSGLHGRTGDWAAALAGLQGVDPSAPGLSPRARCVVELNSGLALQLLGRHRASRDRLQAAVRLAEEHGIDDLAAAALHNLGRLSFLRGELPEALTLMARARRRSPDLTSSGADLDRARVLLEAGQLDAAEELLVQAEQEARAAGLAHDVGEISLERARRSLLLGDHARARTHALAARRSFARLGEDSWRTRAELLRLGAELAGGGRPGPVARQALALAEGSARAAGVGLEASLLAAESAARAGDVAAARAVLPRRVGAATLPQRLQLALARTTVALAAADPEAALARLRGAAAVLASEQRRSAGLDSRTAIALHGRRLAELDVGLALGTGSAAAVLRATERWRGLSTRGRWVVPSGDPTTDDLVAAMRRTGAELREAGDETSRQPLVRELARLERAVRERGWMLAAAQEDVPDAAVHPTSVSALGPALAGRDAGLVSFLSWGGRLRAVTVTPRSTRLHDLADAADVLELASRLAAGRTALAALADPRLREVVERSQQRATSRLDALLSPALPGTGRVVVVPTRVTASLAWRQLPCLLGRPVTVSPSATGWLRGLDAGAARAATRTPEPRTSLTAVAGPALERAADEARAVAACWPGGKALTGDRAVGAALTAALRSDTVVHVAAHGSHHDQSPLFSSVLVADGPLFAHEFERVGVGAGHVVLSSCDVGRARVRPGEESLGLAAALIACGVRTVVAAVAPVRDDVAQELMTRYHAELAAGSDSAEALLRASCDVPDAGLFCGYGTDWRVGGAPAAV
ncbi:CHAT domain-containing protein [Auraticoccus monumenti]|uniref:CHAT domain-containing protein n=1 Tax=Auraticoccus monumenti TaxID=675864 RepID=A0A1G6TQI5_9ACTN|nr:CHAT domain-containing protein [Auraticoccus monumenti]SDD30585.1 CHAT domain-containing protein [Auraticoccus monumenti]